MRQKKNFPCEAAYLIGLICLAFGAALMARADLGMSMVVAPAYLLHVKLSRVWPFFSFGMAEYVFQALLLAVLCLVLRKVKLSFLFSFATAVLYGLILDLMMKAAGAIPIEGIVWRLALFIWGLLFGAAGVALVIRTYITPEVYELFVKELSEKYRVPFGKVKTVYDCLSCLLGIALSFLFFGFGRFEGVKLGTVFSALTNGWLISRFSRVLDSAFRFTDELPLRRIFEK